MLKISERFYMKTMEILNGKKALGNGFIGSVFFPDGSCRDGVACNPWPLRYGEIQCVRQHAEDMA